MEQLGKRTLCVNLRIYPLVGVNQRSMRVRHAAKSTPNALFGIWPNQRSMRVWHAAGFQPRFSSVGATSRSRAGARSYRMSEATSHGEYHAYSPKCAWR